MKVSNSNLHKSYKLSSQQIEDAVNPMEMIALFEKEQISQIVIGGHLLSCFTETVQATVDVKFFLQVARTFCERQKSSIKLTNNSNSSIEFSRFLVKRGTAISSTYYLLV